MSLKLLGIRIKNFKSFKGTHEIEGLDDQFTAIVGPNGSGKSNVIDSILFVLGFRARKMRHTSLRSLVTTGCTECSVELLFNKFKISRALLIRGSVHSQYYLDDREVTHPELCAFVREQGIDLDTNRFLILQGEIENISTMNSMELLSYVEECIGTSVFASEIDSLANQIVKGEEQVAREEHTLKFIENDYIYKKEQHDNCVTDLYSQYEVLGMKRMIIRMKHEISERREAAALKKKKELEVELKEIQERTKESSRVLGELTSKVDCLGIHEKEEAAMKIKTAFQQHTKELKRIEKIEAEISRLREEAKEREEAIRVWDERASANRAKLSENESRILEIQKEEEKVKRELKRCREFEEQAKRKASYEQQVINLLNKRNLVIEKKEKIRYKTERIAELEAKISENGSTETVSREELTKLKDDLETTRTEILKRKRFADEFRHVEMTYKREREVLDTLKGIRGVHGSLRSLGSVESGYEVAVEAACRSLNSIVVDTTQVAEHCIEIINRKGMPRTTFIILDRIEQNIPKFTKEMLCSHITCDSLHVPAFYYALGDTRVVETMEEARELAFGRVRHRVVTVQGQLLEKSGVMSGGKQRKRPKSVEELEKIYEKMKSIYMEKQRIAERMATTKGMVEELNKLRLEVSQTEDVEDDSEGEIARLKREIAMCSVESLPADVQKLVEANKRLLIQRGELEKENRQLQVELAVRPESSGASNKLRQLEDERGRIREPEELEWNLGLRGAYELVTGTAPTSNNMMEGDVQRVEKAHKRAYQEFKDIQQEIMKLKEEMGEEYHREARTRNELEMAEESLGECKIVKSNCSAKQKLLEGENEVLVQLFAEVKKKVPETVEDAFGEMTESELRKRSKELIEAVSEKEAEQYASRGGRDLAAIFKEFKDAQTSFLEAKKQCDEMRAKIKELQREREEKVSERTRLFMEGLGVINGSLREIFTAITMGGNAELELVDFLDPFGSGIQLSVMPPKKTWKKVSNLSGGEKTLSSISLIFALHKYRASPIYIMDEIDAALDYHNVGVIAQYIKKIKSQFIVISLRSNMFEAADKLLGVYKIQNVSHSLLVDTSRFRYQ